ncbi:hypothetical protein GCM10023188_39620 [Pontibacter saemangeumensis]|uniref:Uncharacterized protein n=1 Tax=Pontibacter saemangeumensis TaxID=1084525 RepID=A0ABP8LZM5_9BACT
MGNVAEAGVLIQADTRIEDMQHHFENATIITGGHYTHRQEVKCLRVERIARDKGAKKVHYYINENMQLFKITYAPLSEGGNVISSIDLLEHQTKEALLLQRDIIVDAGV